MLREYLYIIFILKIIFDVQSSTMFLFKSHFTLFSNALLHFFLSLTPALTFKLKVTELSKFSGKKTQKVSVLPLSIDGDKVFNGSIMRPIRLFSTSDGGP